MPDGVEGRSLLNSSCQKKAAAVSYHVFGTFTEAKERIVEAGRRFAAASKDGAIVADANPFKRGCFCCSKGCVAGAG
jgi:hypothetical protein